MIFFVKSATWSISITTLIFTFVPETYFEKKYYSKSNINATLCFYYCNNILLDIFGGAAGALHLKGIITKLKLSMAIF